MNNVTLMRPIVIAAILVQLGGCASSQPSVPKSTPCDSLHSRTSVLLNSLAEINAAPNHEQIAIFLHEERLNADMKSALDKCIAAYEFDFSKVPIVDAAAVPRSMIEGAPSPLNAGFHLLRQQLDSQLKKAFTDFQIAWMGLLTSTMKSNRRKYKFNYVVGCEAEAESMSRSVISNIGRDSSYIADSPVYLLYSKCLSK